MNLQRLHSHHSRCKALVVINLTLMPLVSSSSKEPMSNASAAFTSPLGGIKGGEYCRCGGRKKNTCGFQKEAVTGEKNGRLGATGTLLDLCSSVFKITQTLAIHPSFTSMRFSPIAVVYFNFYFCNITQHLFHSIHNKTSDL